MAKKRKKKRSRLKRFGLAVLTLAICGISFTVATNQAVLLSAHGRVHTDLASLPDEPVGLVLGTSPKIGGLRNVFFEHRMNAAAELYRAGKVKKLLVSGDNGSTYYDEPTAMRDALISRGIPSSDIVLDYAGFRTLDSVVRAKTVFGLKHLTIVTDDFHLPRALYIAQERGLDAVGYQSKPVKRADSPWTYTREVGARSLVWLDLHILNRQPKFNGPPEPIHV